MDPGGSAELNEACWQAPTALPFSLHSPPRSFTPYCAAHHISDGGRQHQLGQGGFEEGSHGQRLGQERHVRAQAALQHKAPEGNCCTRQQRAAARAVRDEGHGVSW
jgi:hypothetical protein